MHSQESYGTEGVISRQGDTASEFVRTMKTSFGCENKNIYYIRVKLVLPVNLVFCYFLFLFLLAVSADEFIQK